MKRFFDFLFSLILIIPISFLIIILSILILLIDHFLPFHFQKRVGKNGKLFICYKLQTMKPPKNKDLVGETEKDVYRVTKLGEIIRDHGWDELPQIVNVLLGNMSFIGPRPLLLKTIERIRDKNPEIRKKVDIWEDKRKKMKPGISGWHQVHLEKKASILELENHRCSLKGKIVIVIVTIIVFIFGKNISSKFYKPLLKI